MTLTAALAATVGLSQQAGQTQTAPPPRLSFDLGIGLTDDSNQSLSVTDPDPATVVDTTFGLHLNTRTDVQSLAFSFQGIARIGDKPGVDLREPTATLGYHLDTGNSRLSVDASYRQAPVNLFDPVILNEGGVPSLGLIAADGTLTTASLGFSFETGIRDPIGFRLSGSAANNDYSDTSDPAVFNSSSNSLDGAVLFRPDAINEIALSFGTNTQSYDNPEQTERKGRTASLGLTRTVSPALKVNASVGYSQDSTTEFGTKTETSGLTAALGLERAMPNGTASANLTLDRDALGARNTLSFGRTLDLPRGKLAATAGVTARAGGSAQLIGTLVYSETLASGTLGVNLSRDVSLNSDNEDVANTSLGLSYLHDITPVSDFGLSLDVLASGGGGSAGVDGAQRQTLSITYSHDLTADWRLTTGYQYRHLHDQVSGDASSNSVFLNVNRSFTLWP